MLLARLPPLPASPRRCLGCVPGALSSSPAQLCLSALGPGQVTSQGPPLSGSRIFICFCYLKNPSFPRGSWPVPFTALASGNLFEGPQGCSHGGDATSYPQLCSEGESGLWLLQNLLLFQEDVVLCKSPLRHPGMDPTGTYGAKGPNPQLLRLPP